MIANRTKPSQRAKIALGAAVGAAALLALGGGALMSRSTAVTAQGAEPAVDAPRAPARFAAWLRGGAASGTVEASADASEVYPEGADVPDDIPPAGMEKLIWIPSLEKRIGARRPQLVEHRHLAEKAIRTAAENSRMKALLADPKMVATVAADLRATAEKTLDQTRLLQRTYEVDFLAEAMSWEGNPAHDAARQAIVDSIAFDNLDKGRPDDLRRSFVGDKMELLAVLRANDPAAADAVVKELSLTPMAKAMDYANVVAHHLVETATRPPASPSPPMPPPVAR